MLQQVVVPVTSPSTCRLSWGSLQQGPHPEGYGRHSILYLFRRDAFAGESRELRGCQAKPSSGFRQYWDTIGLTQGYTGIVETKLETTIVCFSVLHRLFMVMAPQIWYFSIIGPFFDDMEHTASCIWAERSRGWDLETHRPEMPKPTPCSRLRTLRPKPHWQVQGYF